MSVTERDLLSLLETQVSRYSHRMLYAFLNRDVSSSQDLSYLEIYERAIIVAATLQHRGLQRSPVALLYPHGADFIIAFLGAILAGAWPMPLAKARGRDWSSFFSILSVSGARTVLTVSTMQKLVPESPLQACGARLLITDATGAPADVPPWQRPSVRPDDPAFIQYTSGSTARPRGVIVTHANVLHNSERIRRSFGCSEHEVSVSWLPFHHDMGLIGHIIQPLYSAMPNYFLAPSDFVGNPCRWLTAISRVEGTISGAPNFGYALCAGIGEAGQDMDEALDLSTWRLAYCGAERIVPAVLKRFAKRFRSASFDENAFFPCYGMAESTLFVCGQYGVTCSSDGRHTAVGSIKDAIGILIVDEVECTELPDGEIGEVWLKSPSVSSGYFNDPEATRSIFDQTLNATGGYLRTGDLGFISNGALHFVGRVKNVIKRRGRTFHAEDIEQHIEQGLLDRGVRRCAAFSVTGAEDEALVLLLEHDDAADPADLACTPAEASALVCGAFGIVPDVVKAVSKRSLPLTTSGKLQREICRDRYLQSIECPTDARRLAGRSKELLHERK